LSKGFLIFAQNTKDVNYVQQAYALALSIKFSQHTYKDVTLVTNDIVPKKYQKVFDKIIPIPWVDTVIPTRYAAEHRWKLYHVTPYEETIVLDSDMLMLEDITAWWSFCSPYDLTYCSQITNHKLEPVIDTVHRKAFISNSLPSPYCALHYFKKNRPAYEFYKILEFVCNNWEWCYDKFAPSNYQNCLSMDLATSIAIKLSGIEGEIIHQCSPLSFVHMKPFIQGWDLPTADWQDSVSYILNTKGELVVGNIKQSKLFHYTEKSFLSKKIIQRLEELNNGN
jgi:hypothetical protein